MNRGPNLATLAIIPSFARRPQDLEVLETCLTTLRDTTRYSHCAVLVVDDGSPLEGSVHLAHTFGAGAIRTENRGFSRAVNVGLRQANYEGRDAVLVNTDIEFTHKGWLEAMRESPGDVVGALLLYPKKCVQHSGIYYSSLHRAWSERFKFAPSDLPAVHVARDCPVTGALQYIRRTTMETIGYYDEDFRLGWEDVDYCLRAFDAGLTCRYEPKAVAVHHESFSRGRKNAQIEEWTRASWKHLHEKHDGKDFTVWEHGGQDG
jgi:GT2 family glycosyltransferase